MKPAAWYFVELGNDEDGRTGCMSGQGAISGANPDEPVYQDTRIGFLATKPPLIERES